LTWDGHLLDTPGANPDALFPSQVEERPAVVIGDGTAHPAHVELTARWQHPLMTGPVDVPIIVEQYPVEIDRHELLEVGVEFEVTNDDVGAGRQLERLVVVLPFEFPHRSVRAFSPEEKTHGFKVGRERASPVRQQEERAILGIPEPHIDSGAGVPLAAGVAVSSQDIDRWTSFAAFRSIELDRKDDRLGFWGVPTASRGHHGAEREESTCCKPHGRHAEDATTRLLSRGSSAESFKNCDPSGSLSNLRLAVPFDFVALRAA